MVVFQGFLVILYFMVILWGSNGGLMVIYWPIYPLVMADIAIEHVRFIIDLPSYKMVIFHSYVSLPEGNGYCLMCLLLP
jgi:hypothetical protein